MPLVIRFNKIKHARTELTDGTNNYNYELANLKNVLNSLAALYMLLYVMNEQFYGFADTDMESSIFEIDKYSLK